MSFSFSESWARCLSISVAKGSSFCRSPASSRLEVVRDRHRIQFVPVVPVCPQLPKLFAQLSFLTAGLVDLY